MSNTSDSLIIRRHRPSTRKRSVEIHHESSTAVPVVKTSSSEISTACDTWIGGHPSPRPDDHDLNNSDLWLAQVKLSPVHDTGHWSEHLQSPWRQENGQPVAAKIRVKECQQNPPPSATGLSARENHADHALVHGIQRSEHCSNCSESNFGSLLKADEKASGPGSVTSPKTSSPRPECSRPETDPEDIFNFSEEADLFEEASALTLEGFPKRVLQYENSSTLMVPDGDGQFRNQHHSGCLPLPAAVDNFVSVHQTKGQLLLCKENSLTDTKERLNGNWNESFPDVEINPAETVPVQISRTVTPKSGGSFLKDRLKNRLLQNASSVTPAHDSLEELRNKSISKAKMEASQIRREGLVDGIGPFYGLPSKVQELLSANRKIHKLYDWQDECLKLPAVYQGGNLIYTLPTSGGKTLVAEILILRQLLCKKNDALLVLPYISIVQEKVRVLSEFATELSFLVEEYAGSKGRFPPTKRRQKHSLFVATIEKGQSLVNSLVEAGRLEELGLVVVDELHMIGEGGSRGSAMESTLLKVLHATKSPPQVIGMSATLNNIGDLAKFLRADIFSSDFRPVSLTEYVKLEDNLYQVDNKALVPEDKLQHDKILTFPCSEESKGIDPDHLLHLVLEVIPDNSCLLFCPTKRYCENVALTLARLMCKYHRHLTSIQKDKRKALLQELHADGGGKLCPTLEYTVHFGLAYHHSGLTMDERRLIEDAYSDGVLCLLTCTSTLAAGVNLPAKRVILRSPYVGADFIKHSQYKQMTGRAGRAGLDSSGESILIAKKTDMPKVLDLLSGPQDVCHSSLMYHSGKGLRALLLSLIGLQAVETTQAAFAVMQNTLLAVQAAQLGVDVAMATRCALQELLNLGLVVQKKVGSALSQQHQDDLLQIADRTHHSTQGSSSCALRDCHTQQVLQLAGDSDVGETESQDLFLERSSQRSKKMRTEEAVRGCDGVGTSQLAQGEDVPHSMSEVRCSASHQTSDSLQHLQLGVTELGRATFKGSVDLEFGSRLYGDLIQGKQSLVLANHLHLLYLVTPYDLAKDLTPSWMIYLQQLGTLSADELRVASLIGVTESFVVRKASGQSTRQKVDMSVVQRFYLTLMLYELWKQYTVWDVAERFQQPRGFIQSLLSSAASFASCVLRFCQELPEFWAYQDLLGNFGKRLAYCVSMELLPLMEVPGVKLGRARQLHTAGYETLQSLAAADPSHLVSKVQFLTHKAARQIISAAKVILEEKTEALLDQVEQLVPLPLPLTSSSQQGAGETVAPAESAGVDTLG